jgi:predicted ATP-grasp superfamily ATP-dependent carboligase
MNRASQGLTILIPDGESHFTLPVVTCLGRARGTRVHVLSTDSSARVRLSRHCHSFEAITADDESRLRALRQAIRCHRPDVVLPVCETGTRLLARHREELETCVALPPLPGSTEMGDKWRLARKLEALRISHPPTLLWTGDVGFRKRIATLPFPVLIKPRHLSGGAGIRAFSDPIVLIRFLEARPHKAMRYVVQSFVAGTDVDVSVLCRGGRVLAHATQRPIANTLQGYRPATEIEMFDHSEAEGLVRKMCEALDWSGVANIDLRIDARDGSVSVIEMNPRYWSSLLASHAAGINFPHLACLAALDVDFDVPRHRPNRFFQARSSMREWLIGLARGRLTQLPRLGETVWPYLISDPLPHAMGRMAAASRRAPARVRRLANEARAA